MMKVIYPTKEDGKEFTNPEEEARYSYAIFLAGPCPRVDYSDDWRFDAVKYLEEIKYDGVVFIPTNPKYDVTDKDYLFKQTSWEVEAMDVSDKVVFWIPRDKEHPAFTTNIELGSYLLPERIGKTVVGMPDWGIKNDYIKIRLNMLNKKYYNDLKDMLEQEFAMEN